MMGAPLLVARAALRAGAGYVLARRSPVAQPEPASPPASTSGWILPATGWDQRRWRRAPGGPGRWWSARVSGPAAGGRRSDARAGSSPRPPPLPWSTPTGSPRSATSGRSARCVEGRSGPVGDHTPRRRVPPASPGRRRPATTGSTDGTRTARPDWAVVLLKGSPTVVADPTGTGPPRYQRVARLATAGTGDVLSGMIGAFLARGLPRLEAAAFAAHAHGGRPGLGPAGGSVHRLRSVRTAGAGCPWLSGRAGDPRPVTRRRHPCPSRAPDLGRRAPAEIDLGAVRAQRPVLAGLAAPASLCAVVKAGGYGHGAVRGRRRRPGRGGLLAGGGLGRGRPGAARPPGINRAGPGALGARRRRPWPTWSRCDSTPTLYTPAGMEALRGHGRGGRAASRLPGARQGRHRDAPGRRHARRRRSRWPAWQIDGCPGLELEGFWTHFAVSDEVDNPYTGEQLARFVAALLELGRAGRAAPGSPTRPTRPAPCGTRVAVSTWCAAGSRCTACLPSLTAPTGRRVPGPAPGDVAQGPGLVRQEVAAGERLSYGLRYRAGRGTRSWPPSPSGTPTG